MMPYGGLWYWIMMLSMLLFWVLILVGVFVLIRKTSSDSSGSAPPREEDGALAILRERYARGEIDKEEYERMKSDLTK